MERSVGADARVDRAVEDGVGQAGASVLSSGSSGVIVVYGASIGLVCAGLARFNQIGRSQQTVSREAT